MTWIDDIVNGLIGEVGSSNVYDIASHLDVKIIRDNEKQNPLLRHTEGLYLRDFDELELIIIRDDLENEKEVIAHELGHALLHDELMSATTNHNYGKLENEAEYFAFKLLNKKIDQSMTVYDLAKILKLKEDTVYRITKNPRSYEGL